MAGTLYDLPAVVKQTPYKLANPFFSDSLHTIYISTYIHDTLYSTYFAFIQSALFQDLEATVEHSVLTYEHLPDVVLSRILNDSLRQKPV